MGKELSNSGIHPKNFLIQVTEVGKTQTNVRIPFWVVRAGMKIGQVVSARKTAKYGNELDLLEDIDMDAILSSLNKVNSYFPVFWWRLMIEKMSTT